MKMTQCTHFECVHVAQDENDIVKCFVFDIVLINAVSQHLMKAIDQILQQIGGHFSANVCMQRSNQQSVFHDHSFWCQGM